MADAPARAHLVMALPQVRGRSIGDNALHRAAALSRHLRVTVISNDFPGELPAGVTCLTVRPARFDALRRFAHVPNEIGFARSVRARLLRLVDEDPFDLVLCHGYTLTRLAGHELRRSHGIACAMFMHGHIFTRPRGTYDVRLTAWYRWLAPRCYRETDLLLALSPAQKALAESAGAPPERVIVAPNGIRVEDLGLDAAGVSAARARPAPGDPLRLLYVGRLAVEKGVEVLLKACALLQAAGVEFTLDLVGDGPLGPRLRRLADGLGLGARLRFLGPLPRRDLGPCYLRADVQCVPSLDEPLGTVVLEGMVTGCPVVASRTGGIPFMIRDGIDGRLVPPGDAGALAAALADVARGPAAARARADSARAAAARRFSWEAIAADIHAALAPQLARADAAARSA